MRPSRTSTSACSSRLEAGSMTRPPRSRIGRPGSAGVRTSGLMLRSLRTLGHAAGQEVEHGHAYGDAVRHLVEDDGVRAVGDVAVDLDSTIHRTGVQDDEVARRALHALARHAEHAIG